jgi:hypothetical protein
VTPLDIVALWYVTPLDIVALWSVTPLDILAHWDRIFKYSYLYIIQDYSEHDNIFFLDKIRTNIKYVIFDVVTQYRYLKCHNFFITKLVKHVNMKTFKILKGDQKL